MHCTGIGGAAPRCIKDPISLHLVFICLAYTMSELASTQASNEVLNSTMAVLERMGRLLEGQQMQIDALQKMVAESREGQRDRTTDRDTIRHSWQSVAVVPFDESAAREDHNRNKSSCRVPGKGDLFYGYNPVHLHFKAKCSIDDIPHYKEIIGPAWSIPDDSLLPLLFAQHHLEELSLSEAQAKANTLIDLTERLVKNGGALTVCDIYKGKMAVYELGVSGSPMKESKYYKLEEGFNMEPGELAAPWNRIMLVLPLTC
jgi:hypothetical protein